MRCSKCESENPTGKRFCGDCGAPFGNPCPRCGAENPAGKRFCGDCGAPLTSPLPWSAPEAMREHQDGRLSLPPETDSPPNGERKMVTALFADIKGSMELMEHLDPEEARGIIDPVLQLMAAAVRRYDGYLVQSTGDGIFALFGAPVAHEDHPQRAIHAALRMQDEMRRYAAHLLAEQGLNLQARVGVNTGEVVVRSLRTDSRHTEYTPIGHSTGLAARLQALANPGAVVISGQVAKLVEGYFQLKSLGAARIKGVDSPVMLFEVVGIGPLRTKLEIAARRGLTRFVGRQPEMEQLLRASEQARSGHGQIVGVMGEPGLGKSRLFYEFKLTSRVGWLVLEAYSASYGKASPYLPVIELLKGYFEIALEDDGRKRREKVMGKVLALDRSLEDTLPYLLALLSIEDTTSNLAEMDPQVRRRRTLDALKKLLLRESLNQPLIVMFEDLHWIDSETQSFLDLLSDSIASARILLLTNYRPEFRHDWARKTYYTGLHLTPLGREEAEELLTALLGSDSRLAGLRRLILEKTEGTPFFIEEVVQALREEGVVPADGAVASPDTPIPAALHIPTTVQGVLAGRIDRLPAEEKSLLQHLAVIGREFSARLVRSVVKQPEEQIDRLLSSLQGKEFLYEQPAFPEPEYIFKHALTQEVAYNSLLVERRKALHEQTAQVIETLFQSRLADHYSELAHHYTRSGNTPKAIDYLQLAGQQAVQRSANNEAIHHLTRALELLKTAPDTDERATRELALQTAVGPAWMAVKGYAAPEVERAYTRARELCEQTGETRQLFTVLRGFWIVRILRAELKTARDLGEQLLRLAESARDPALLVEAHYTLGETLFCLGDLAAAYSHHEQGIALYDPELHRSHAFLYGVDPGSVVLQSRRVSLVDVWLSGSSAETKPGGTCFSTTARSLKYARCRSGLHFLASSAASRQAESQRARSGSDYPRERPRLAALAGDCRIVPRLGAGRTRTGRRSLADSPGSGCV
jgi:class 3 adenylate cyclase/tetratricopeptide (TPR) repeat protein